MNTPDYVKLEMDCARIMMMQERSGFPFNLKQAEIVKEELAREAKMLSEKICARFPFFPGKVATPKRSNKTKGWHAGCPFTKLEEFNPTSRRHIIWALSGDGSWPGLGVTFTKVTDSGGIKADAATLQEVAEDAKAEDNTAAVEFIGDVVKLLDLQKGMGQLSEGANSWLNMVDEEGLIHHSCSLDTRTGRNAHRGPNLGQVNSAPWARQLFTAFPDQVMLGCDLDGLELCGLAHYLFPYDNGAFADKIVNGNKDEGTDVHSVNAKFIGCTRNQAKTIAFAFIYGAGAVKLGHNLKPEGSDHEKKAIGDQIKKDFLKAIPGLQQLIDAVKMRVRSHGRIKGLDGRPIMCDSEHKGLNFCIQSAGAIISKRWVVLSQQLLDEAGYIYGEDYYRLAYVHDEQQLSVRPELVEPISTILTECAVAAGKFYDFRVPITASACSGANWAETH